MNVLGIIASAVAALFITVVLAKGVRRTALRSGIGREPGARPSRAGVVRRLGGATVVIGVVTAAAAGSGLGAAGDGGRSVTGLLAGAGIVAVLGLVHEVRPLGVPLRMAVQTAAATLAVCLAGLPPVAGVLAVIWIVLVTQAFALLDTSDGALATVAPSPPPGCSPARPSTAGPGPPCCPPPCSPGSSASCCTSWHPARIRPGASASLFTGFVLASSGALIHARHRRSAPPGPRCPSSRPSPSPTPPSSWPPAAAPHAPCSRTGGDHIMHRLRRIRVTVPGTAVVLGLWAGVAAEIGTLVYAGVLHPPSPSYRRSASCWPSSHS
ncbi:undecaprenyl/decaprenyl-phosphate alpha-N-acetylglucosaminyl 1-phosphate transferase [Streptomyces sp. MT29]|nr:undecaprenyl/decaprenyl-phosphate alpha-N-acetylglucosaminyl 1-phosphate transferase [Streptomyces sp. MT29]